MRICRAILLCSLSTAALITIASTAGAAVIWNQSTSGPLSGFPSVPTALALSAGTNSIVATVGGGSGETGINQNWVNINVPAGLQLSHVFLAAYASTDAQGFIGVAAGTSFAGGESAVNTASSYLGYSHYGTGATNGSLPATNLVGADLLPLMGNNVTISPGSAGFTPPLPSGAYTFLIQQLGATTNYQFDFDATTVPEPASALVVIGGALPLVIQRRLRR